MIPSEILKSFTKVEDGDFVDHLNCYYTTWLLAFMCILTSSKQYFGSPIQCMVPAHWRSDWAQYAREFCFAASTFHVQVEQNSDADKQQHIGYYQWVPLLFAFESLSFYVPSLLFRTRDNIKHSRTVVRCVYLLNIVVQLVIMSLIMRFQWPTENHFPLTTLCHVSRRQHAHDAYATIDVMQCVLAINVVNHKLFVFLWIWLLTVFAITTTWTIFRALRPQSFKAGQSNPLSESA